MTGLEFDPIDFINKTYKESTLYEINDALIILAKSLSKTLKENKDLISAHFSKFVQCRSIMEDIWMDMKDKGLDSLSTDTIENSLGLLSEKFEDICGDIKGDIIVQKHNSRRLYYQNRYSRIFEMKEELRRNVNSPERFAEIYRKARESFEEVRDSVFMQRKFEEVRPEVRLFLDNVYTIISKEHVSFEDACHYFDLYFTANGSKSDQAIMATLLVNFKSSTAKKREASAEYIQYLFISLRKLVKYADENFAAEGIGHFFDCLDSISREMGLAQARTLLNRMARQSPVPGLSPTLAKEFNHLYFEFKLGMVKTLLYGRDVENALLVHQELNEFFSGDERQSCQSIFLDFAIDYIKNKRCDNYEYLKTEVSELRRLRPCLGHKSSEQNKKLSAFLKKNRSRIIEEIAEAFSGTIRDTDEVGALMEALKILENSPSFSKDIIFEAKNDILAKPILHYFLQKYIRMGAPALSSSDEARVKKLERQFGFLVQEGRY